MALAVGPIEQGVGLGVVLDLLGDGVEVDHAADPAGDVDQVAKRCVDMVYGDIGVGLGPEPHGCVEGLVVGGLVEAAGAFFNPLVAWAEHLTIAGFTKIQHAFCSREGFAVFVAVLLIGR